MIPFTMNIGEERISLSKLIIYGACPECGGYMLNSNDTFTASFGAEANIKCQNCDYYDTELEQELLERRLEIERISKRK